MSDGERDPIEALRRTFAPLLAATDGSHAMALGWATVEFDRAERDFAATFPGAVASAVDLDADQLLGARVRLLRPGFPGIPRLVLLEASTEGRLAATLARYGEGPAAIWTGPSETTERRAGRRSVTTPGPFGPEVLLLDGPVQGPHRLVVLAGPGTITP